MGISYNIGDLVRVKSAYINPQGDLKFKAPLGVITDRAGDAHGRSHRSYKVLAQNGKHDWSPKSDLFLVQRTPSSQ